MSADFYAAALILVISAVTILLRFLPFAVFAGSRKVPKAVLYLGDVLPSAVLGMLVIYCLRDLDFAAPSTLYALASCAVTAAVQLLRHNTILSITAGTALYMLLLHLV